MEKYKYRLIEKKNIIKKQQHTHQHITTSCISATLLHCTIPSYISKIEDNIVQNKETGKKSRCVKQHFIHKYMQTDRFEYSDRRYIVNCVVIEIENHIM